MSDIKSKTVNIFTIVQKKLLIKVINKFKLVILECRVKIVLGIWTHSLALTKS